MELLDSRRLTGANVISPWPGAVIDVACADDQTDAVVGTWHEQLSSMLRAVGWDGCEVAVRRVPGGVSLALRAPIDVLYAATEINDWAWEATSQTLGGEALPALEPAAASLRETIAAERNPALLQLRQAALTRGVPFLSDDDEVSVGLGILSRTFPVGEVPAPGDLDWPGLGNIPLGLVTGTNGKTTTVRLAAAMARAAGQHVGLTSTDWIAVDDEILERGDYSGPGGARTVLRDQRVSLAVLETARGGLLRRGLGVERADAALITNIAEDHLGEFGIADLQALADIKWVVTRALGKRGTAVLNADDPLLVARARGAAFPVVWFTPDRDHSLLRAHLAAGGTACTVDDGHIVYLAADGEYELPGIADIPITLGGFARHNVYNALAATALIAALGVPMDAISRGLQATRPADNPGRCNLFQVGGANVLVDFAHNPHGITALFEVARNFPARRRLLVLGQAGDRSDSAIRDLARSAWQLGLDRVIVKEMARYSRGRERGEIPAMIRDELLGAGAPADAISYEAEELDATRQALEWAGPEDLVILLIHEDVDGVLELLRAAARGP